MNSDSPIRDSARVRAACALIAAWASVSHGTEIQGFTEPYRDIDVAAVETGVIEAIRVKEGDRVAEDQIVVNMDGAVLEISVEIAKSIKESRGQLESAREELKLQSHVVAKLEELRERQHASEQELRRARSQQRIAEARLKAVQEELAVKKLEFERAEAQLERRRLRSPIDGIVTRILKDRGEAVSMSEPTVLKVVQLDPLLVIFLVPADVARSMAKGSRVQVRFAGSGKTAPAEVEFPSPTTDPQSGLTRVRVRIPNPDERLPCGGTCFLILSGDSSSRLTSTER